MKSKFLLFLTLAASFIPIAAQIPALVPLPAKIKQNDGELTLKQLKTASADPAFKAELSLLSEHWKSIDLPKFKTQSTPGDIRLLQSKQELPEGAYLLKIDASGITISSSSASGAFYGGQTLSQLILHSKLQDKPLPCLEIQDQPRFAWRGLMLDEARHFMGKAYVMSLLDQMARHKLNVFHWHLTDDQGWRIEIKAYPKLTSIGAFRGEGTKLPTPKWDKKNEKDPDGPKYGGFYTQKDIREIVAYAAERHIEIIPELDMPGHAMAFAAAYPEVLPKQDGEAGEGVHGLRGNVISVAREENYRMLDKIYGELASLFPSKYVHVGGDEVNVQAWKVSPEHRAMMDKHGYKNPHQLQNHFMLRLEKILNGHGKTLLGWNEIMHGGQLSKDTAIMAWISVNAGLNAARKGHPTVMAPGPHCYFDMKYPGPGETGHWWAGIVDTKRAYEWNPLFVDQLKPEEQARVLGVHCALWTEFVPDPENADYKLWPRACATAEVAWSLQEKRSWDSFSRRLGQHLSLLDKTSDSYRVPPPSATQAKGLITIAPAYPGTETVFTTDGSEPTASSPRYQGKPIPLSQLSALRYRTIRPSGRMSKVAQGATLEPVLTADSRTWKGGSTTEKLPLEGVFDQDGNWIAQFSYLGGKEALELKNLALYQGNKVIHRFDDLKLDPKNRRQTARFELQGLDSSSTYHLTFEGKSKDARFQITIDRSPFLEPNGATVSTDIGIYGNHRPTNLTDWDRSSFFWSNRAIKKGDSLLIDLGEALELREIILPTGKAGSNEDILAQGVLEVSTDGEAFETVAKFNLGTASAKFNKAKNVRYLRITAQQDQTSWLIVRDPQLK